MLKALTGEGILVNASVSSCVGVWQNSQRLANRCDYSDIQERGSQAMYKLQRDITRQFARESICQMPWKEMPRNSGIKTGRWSMQFSSGSQHHGLNSSLWSKSSRNLGSMAKTSLHALSILKKHMTEFLGINFGRFCWIMALMVNCYAPLSHSTADRRFVFG